MRHHPTPQRASQGVAATSAEAVRRARDAGAALVITIMIVALVTVITTTLLVITVGNVGGARAARDASLALDAADAGVSQAMAYLRTSGINTLSCSPTCATNAWGNKTTPKAVTIPGNTFQSYATWIEPIAPFPDNNPGIYTIHSTGRSGTGVRSIEVEVSLGSRRFDLPIAVYARSINGGGSASVARESIFTTGCVYRRDQIAMSGIDSNYGIPVAVHSSKFIDTGNGNNQNCTSGGIHAGGTKCATAYPYDQDSLGGGPLAGACAGAGTYPDVYGSRDLDGNGSIDVNGSYIRDDATLRTLFHLKDKPLTDSELDDLRAIAIDQGSYYTSHAGFASPNPNVYPNAVMFFDLKATDLGGTVDLNNVTGWGRAANLNPGDAGCLARSLVIVIDGGNATVNSNQQMAMNLILTSPAPYGQVSKANGTADVIGSIYADTINLVGNFNTSLDKCFMANLSPNLLSSTIVELDYREIDRTS